MPPGGAENAEGRAVAGDRLTLYTVVFAITALVTVRFFTETVSILPRAANVIDILVFVWLWLLAALRPGWPPAVPRWIPSLGFAFVLLAALAAAANLPRVAFGPSLVFIYGMLAPLVVYWSVYRLWRPGGAHTISRLVVGLGMLQLLCVGLFSLPSYLATGNPDEISGTFGENPYQLVFFLLIFVSVVAGIYVFEPRSLIARITPILVIAALATVVLAEFRALLLTTALVLLLLVGILGLARSRGYRTTAQAALMLVGFMVVVALGAQHLKLSQTEQIGAQALIAKRLDVAERVLQMYASEPTAVLVGTGPGTYSSRGWATFARSDVDSAANVVGSYALEFTDGVVYRTDVSDRYVRPWLGRSVAGSYSPDSPYMSYTSAAAEMGLPGLVLVLCIYVGGFLAVLRRAIRAARHTLAPDPLPSLLLAATVGLFTLIQMGLLENWLEVTRVTFLSWMLVAIATKEYDAQYQADSSAAA